MTGSRKLALCAVTLSLGLAACGGHATSALPQTASGLAQIPNAHAVSAMHAGGRSGQAADIDEVSPVHLSIDPSGNGTFSLGRGERAYRSERAQSVPVPAFVLACSRDRRDDDDDRCRFGARHGNDDPAYYYIRERVVGEGEHRGWRDQAMRENRHADDDAGTIVTGPGAPQTNGIAFPAANAPLALSAHTRYRFDLVRSNVPLATPTPAATPTPVPTPTPSTIGYCLSYAGTAPSVVSSSPSPAPTSGAPATGFISQFTNATASIAAPAALACAPNGAIDEVGSGNGSGSVSAFSIAAQSFSTLVATGVGQPIARLSLTQIAVDTAGNAYFTGAALGSSGKAVASVLDLSPSGSVTSLGITAHAVAYGTGSDGAAYAVVPDSLGTATYDLVRISNGVAGAPVAFPAACSNLNASGEFAVDTRGNLWFSDAGCGFLSYAAASGTFTAYASSTTANGATSIAVGPDGAIYLGNVDQVVRFDPSTHAATTIALTGTTVDAMIAGPNGDLYLAADADDQSQSWFIRFHTATGAVTQYPGTSGVRGMVVGADGNIYAAATADALVRIDPALAGP